MQAHIVLYELGLLSGPAALRTHCLWRGVHRPETLAYDNEPIQENTQAVRVKRKQVARGASTT